MSRRIFRYLCLLASLCLCAHFGVAQTPVDHPPLAIEIPGFSGPYPYYLSLSETGSPNHSPCSTFWYNHPFKRLANAVAGAEQPSALQLGICVKGDSVLITPTLYYGAFDHQNPPADLEKLRHQTLAMHSGRLNDTVVFQEMEQAGLEPLTLRIVTAQSDNPYHPVTRSDAPSVQIEYAPVDRSFGMVTLHNQSNKAVDAFRVRTSGETGSGSGVGEDKGGSCVLIAPGSSIQVRMGVPQSGGTVNGTFVEDPLPQSLILQSVLFADGTYEGDQQTAADMAVREFGAHVQLVRIKQVAEPTLADASTDDETKMERLRSAVQQLSAQPDSEIIAQFHAGYPAFSQDVLSKAESKIGDAMKGENSVMDHTIQINEPILQGHRTAPPFARWWTAVTECH